MRAYTFVEHIDRPQQRVWDTLVDLPLSPRWRPMIKSMETADGGPLREGGELKVIIQFFGREYTRISITKVFDPPRRWVLHSLDQPTVGGYFEFIVEPEGTGTRVTAICELKAKTFLAWLFLPLIARGERERRKELLGNLKRLVESGP